MIPDLYILIFGLPGLLFAMVFHEYAHAWTATRLGDPTPRADGRLTLNPLAHVDWLGMLMLWIARFGWAKPVMVDPRYFRNPRQSMLWTALAGPAANALLAVISAALVVRLAPYATPTGGWLGALYTILWMSLIYNVALGLFNLVPIPPLDGSRILGSLLPPRMAWRYQQLEQYGWIILLLVVASGYAGRVIGPLISLVTYYLLGWVA